MGDRDLSRDEEVVELTRRFKMFLMENKGRYGNVWGQVTSAKFQWMSCVDKSRKRVTVCPLCYEEGHKRVDCPKNDYLVRRCFKCNEVGHSKKDCTYDKHKGDGFLMMRKNGDMEKCTRPRCFKCNYFSHLKASCPLLKNVKDKASTSTSSLGNASILFAKNIDDSSDFEVEFFEISKKHNRFIAYNKKKAKESVVVQPLVDEDIESKKNDEYSDVDEINMEGFCLMAGGTKQRKLNQNHLELAKIKRIMAETELSSDEESAS